MKQRFRTLALVVLVCALSPSASRAQFPDVIDLLTFYGSLRVHVAAFDGGAEIQDNAPRIGFRLNREFPTVTFISRVEWGINLVDSDTRLNLDGSTSSGRGLLTAEAVDQAFTTRLGWIGLDMRGWGELKIGKQWSTYYDVSGYTDRFYVFGGRASGTYVGGTDGSVTGTGRADRSLAYRVKKWGFSLGGLVQLKAADTQIVDTYSASLQFSLLGASLGAAINHADVPPETQNRILGAEGDAESAVAALQFDRGRLYVAALASWQNDHEFVTRDTLTLIYDAAGAEVFVFVDVSNRLGLHGGGNWLKLRNLPSVLDPEFAESLEIKEAYLGGSIYLNATTFFYVEGKLDFGKNRDGARRTNIVTVGVRMDFNYRSL